MEENHNGMEIKDFLMTTKYVFKMEQFGQVFQKMKFLELLFRRMLMEHIDLQEGLLKMLNKVPRFLLKKWQV